MTDLGSRVAAAIGQARTQVDEDDVRNRNTRQGDEGRFGFASPTTVALERMTAQRRALLTGLESLSDFADGLETDIEGRRSIVGAAVASEIRTRIAEALGCSTEEDSDG